MFVAYFTERPYQDRSADWYRRGQGSGFADLSLSNGVVKPEISSALYNRYFDEKLYVEEMGFDGAMLNAHHSTPFCMGGGAMNLEAAVLARITNRMKIVLLGNILPIWDDPLLLAEELATIDLISGGRLVSGVVRGTGRESVAHNAQTPYNWERFQECHDLLVKIWTTDGPFRWDGDHYHFRYVNPWQRPIQQPIPIWCAGVVSKSTVAWSAARRYPYVMLDSELHLTRQTYDYYAEQARLHGYEAGTQHFGYMFKVHVDETEEKAYETGRKLIEGAGNIFLDGSQAQVNPWAQNQPGLNPRNRSEQLPTIEFRQVKNSRGLAAPTESTNGKGAGDADAVSSAEAHEARRRGIYHNLLDRHALVIGTPDTVVPKIRHVLETLRPGNVFFWTGDGDFTHEDTMRGIRLMGEYVLPAIKEIGEQLELKSAFEVDPLTNLPIAAEPAAAIEVSGQASATG
jgi:alkanesulfonate monooxygenase SsuD/methylene tetrahydromethanopterin reductase-like flavin-dependent oxidoreductase (luciferase family)